MTVKMIVTGGTFDKEYSELNGKLFFRRTHIHEMLKLGRARAPVRIKTLMTADTSTGIMCGKTKAGASLRK